MDEADLVRALAIGENEDWEFKKARGGVGPSYLQTVSSFANTFGGIIVAGVESKDNDKTFEVIGLEDPQKYVESLWSALNNRKLISHAPCASKDAWVTPIGELKLVCLRVPEADRRDKPIYLGDNPFKGAYKRRNTGDYACTETEVRQMIRDASLEPQDSAVFDGTDFNNLDVHTFKAFRNVFASHRPGHQFLKLDDEDLLIKIGGMKKGKKRGLTAAGILMFGTTELIQDAFPNLFLDFYELDNVTQVATHRYDNRITSYDGDWEANLFNFYYKTRPSLISGLKTPFGLGDDAIRKGGTPLHDALREAVVNCLVHTDFQMPGTILVGKQSDAFIFRNPGRSLTPISKIIEARHAGEQLSDIRNPKLVQMFHFVGLAERHGSGYPVIFHAWDGGQRHSPRIVEDTERNTVQLNLPLLSHIDPNVERAVQETIGPGFALLSALEKDILLQAYLFGETSNEAIRFSRKDHPRDIGARLKYLADRGWLIREGSSGRGRTYRFPEKGQGNFFELSPVPDGQVAFTPQGEGTFTPQGEGELVSLVRAERAGREEIEAAIVAVCKERYLTVKELAKLLNRTPARLRDNYLSNMVEDGRLIRLYPHFKHPKQAYKAAET